MSVELSKQQEYCQAFTSYRAVLSYSDTSNIHELSYAHSILLENLMDPAHVPISHNCTDWTTRREDAEQLIMTVAERSIRGFAGQWGCSKNPTLMNSLRF
ncbi:hypothetical protein KSP40_PGU001075 [Platanthera guangdongensis]|uniref:Uncharacterized protein n=1 Tax=Platanthera guangdongensis TaxID=2320717 RepID=A0ABR2LDN9_9ASPA